MKGRIGAADLRRVVVRIFGEARVMGSGCVVVGEGEPAIGGEDAGMVEDAGLGARKGGLAGIPAADEHGSAIGIGANGGDVNSPRERSFLRDDDGVFGGMLFQPRIAEMVA